MLHRVRAEPFRDGRDSSDPLMKDGMRGSITMKPSRGDPERLKQWSCRLPITWVCFLLPSHTRPEHSSISMLFHPLLALIAALGVSAIPCVQMDTADNLYAFGGTSDVKIGAKSSWGCGCSDASFL